MCLTQYSSFFPFLYHPLGAEGALAVPEALPFASRSGAKMGQYLVFDPKFQFLSFLLYRPLGAEGALAAPEVLPFASRSGAKMGVVPCV